MPKAKSSNSAASARSGSRSTSAKLSPAAAKVLRRVALHGFLVILALGGMGYGFFRMHQYVERKFAFAVEPPRVVLTNRPVWMSDFLADQIAAAARPLGAHSAFDQQMLKDVDDLLQKDARIAPWISKVMQIRRAYGKAPGDTLELECEYRAPVALVHWGDYYWLVDGSGIKLPEQFTGNQLHQIMFGRDGAMNIRIIDGVTRPPPESGRKWAGDDLAAGVDLVKLLYGKPYAEEIVTVNVSNFSGRRDMRAAHLVLITRRGTQVQWGRPINAKDYFVEVPPAQKLDYLQRIVEKYHHVDGNHASVDIRFDQVTFPTEDNAPGAEANTQ